MEAKLTLKLNNDSISRAKEYVSKIGTSLSAIVENFFDNLTVNNNKSEFSYSPLVNELSGIIHLEENYDYKSDYTSYLDKKYESSFCRYGCDSGFTCRSPSEFSFFCGAFYFCRNEKTGTLHNSSDSGKYFLYSSKTAWKRFCKKCSPKTAYSFACNLFYRKRHR